MPLMVELKCDSSCETWQSHPVHYKVWVTALPQRDTMSVARRKCGFCRLVKGCLLKDWETRLQWAS